MVRNTVDNSFLKHFNNGNGVPTRRSPLETTQAATNRTTVRKYSTWVRDRPSVNAALASTVL